MTPTQQAVDECLQWMREQFEGTDEQEDFEKCALLVSGAVQALEAQVGPNAPEVKRLRESEQRLREALEVCRGALVMASEGRGYTGHGLALVVNRATAALAYSHEAQLAADVAQDTASAGLVLT